VTARSCGECTLCCRLLPVKSIGKLAGHKCKHQRFRTGCAIYNRANMPFDCKIWSCRWLLDEDTADLMRPDRSHYVIDIMPDFITVSNEDGSTQHIQVAQIWVDPKHPDAHRDPALRRWMIRRAEEDIACLIRFNEREAFVIFAPPFDVNGQWHEITSNMQPGPTHTPAEVAEALLGRLAHGAALTTGGK
jgi:hypothetical protein